jgi:hypothetical protein
MNDLGKQVAYQAADEHKNAHVSPCPCEAYAARLIRIRYWIPGKLHDHGRNCVIVSASELRNYRISHIATAEER